MYYLGKGTEFKKENCKEYKTIEGALKAAAKDEELAVWDGTGKIISQLTDNVPEGALETNPDGSVNTYDADGNEAGIMSTEELKAATTLTGDNAAGQEASGDDKTGIGECVSNSGTIYPEKTTRAIVDCDGALNLRRSASWGNESICGRAVRGQSYYIKAIHTVEGKKMLETIGGIFLSGQSEHVRIIEA